MKCSQYLNRCRVCKEENKKKEEKCPNCGADMKCTQNAVVGYNRCQYHGGPNPRNNYYGNAPMSTGTSSKFPIMRLAAKYKQMQENGILLSNRAAIDILDERVKQLLQRVDVEEAPERISKLYTLWQSFLEADEKSDGLNRGIVKNQISDEFEKIYHDYQAWKQVIEILDLRGKQVERELKVIKEMKGLMTAEEGYELVAKVMAAMMRIIGSDSHKLKQVQYEFSRIIGESSDLVIEEDSDELRRDSDTDRGTQGFGEMDKEGILDT